MALWVHVMYGLKVLFRISVQLVPSAVLKAYDMNLGACVALPQSGRIIRVSIDSYPSFFPPQCRPEKQKKKGGKSKFLTTFYVIYEINSKLMCNNN